jgi:hypothetical protein
MSSPTFAHQVVCPECGAENTGSPSRCWLCYQPMPVQAELVEAPAVMPKLVYHDSTARTTLLVVTIAIAILVVLVGIGAFSTDRTLGVVYCVLVAPALLIAAITYAVQHTKTSADPQIATYAGQHTKASAGPQIASTNPWAASLKSFVISLVATLAIATVALAVAVLVAVAAFIAMIVQCFQALGGH